jgi:ribosomal protein L29
MLRYVLLAIAFVTTSGLQVAVPARPAAARSAVRMAMPSMEDARSLSTEEIEKEIVSAKKVRAAAAAAAASSRPSPAPSRHVAERGESTYFSVPNSPPCRPSALTRRCLPTSQELFELRKKVKTRQQVRARPDDLNPPRPPGGRQHNG